ncbi:3-hydroxyacyl-ACP dehydratase FabZ [Enterobacteriaceae endosymbiont of Macroplea appendiculata]|uniref:3-hydroxyacyl-ACP dehydratase FabZ n=1 Tax=Enterobacteriaceae endosymbiont of Macroplea appendiculata TaxID=2675790 RepID=UPI0014490DDE|nr:3-hydroxyacyl-ACP dehydratase FabZ [Enterobacteriaceae endosymbiont of Macroplea appendiculata]QJC30838.1 3-hydroxyacyl-ACP dehydratase FabZ [Enterobacteriaceae endosymbiont of Macroplea appendiculata]
MNNILYINEILNILPHRYPFILIDRIIYIDTNKLVIHVIKNITINEPYFIGHFPNKPIYPGVLILESMLQTTGILLYKTISNNVIKQKMFYIVSIKNIRFKQKVIPGDQIIIKSYFKYNKKNFFFYDSIAIVNNIIVCIANKICIQITK